MCHIGRVVSISDDIVAPTFQTNLWGLHSAPCPFTLEVLRELQTRGIWAARLIVKVYTSDQNLFKLVYQPCSRTRAAHGTIALKIMTVVISLFMINYFMHYIAYVIKIMVHRYVSTQLFLLSSSWTHSCYLPQISGSLLNCQSEGVRLAINQSVCPCEECA